MAHNNVQRLAAANKTIINQKPLSGGNGKPLVKCSGGVKLKTKMRYEIKKDGEKLKVWDSKQNIWITKELPSMEIAKEICDDFNAMDGKDFRPIGLPNFSKGQ